MAQAILAQVRHTLSLTHFFLISYSVMPQAMMSLVCGHVKIFINDMKLAQEFISLLPISPTTTPAAAVCETAIATQNLIADKLQTHCPSLRDAMHLTKQMLKPATTKKLSNINAAHSAHRHVTSMSAAELLQKLEKELDDHMMKTSRPEEKTAVDDFENDDWAVKKLTRASDEEHLDDNYDANMEEMNRSPKKHNRDEGAGVQESIGMSLHVFKNLLAEEHEHMRQDIRESLCSHT